MEQKKIEEEYRQEVFRNKKECPNLYDLELKKNKWRFERE